MRGRILKRNSDFGFEAAVAREDTRPPIRSREVLPLTGGNSQNVIDDADHIYNVDRSVSIAVGSP